ncbi:MAG TPA: hypothetical protein VK790_06385 [Solirubrobacteraceae bacterium]|jgi:hypothetical protein|nr:hypothetical protein [Solirubrobacteraceae bacterium]
MRAVNLIPAEQRSGASVGAGRSQGAAYAVLLLIGGLAAMAFGYGQADHQIASRRSQVATIDEQAQQAQAAAERLAPYASFIALREQHMQAVDALIDSRFDWAHVFHEFGRVLPSQTSISSLTGNVGAATGAAAPSTSSSVVGSSATSTAAAPATSSTPPGSVPTFTLAGCATSQKVVALTLERLRLIDGVKEVSLQSSGSGSGGGAGSSGGCGAHEPAFTLTMTFDPLPSTSAVAAASTARTTSDTNGAGTTPATAGGSAK